MEPQVPPTSPPAERLPQFVIEFDPSKGFSARLDEGMPLVPFLGVLFLQLLGFGQRQLEQGQATEQNALRQAIAQARRSSSLYMPDGSPAPRSKQ